MTLNVAATGATLRPLAVFDLDGTLVTGDTFLPFLISLARRRYRLRPLLTLPMYLGLYACRLLSDRSAKERVLVSFLRGELRQDVAEHADWFARTWVPPRLQDVVVRRLRDHQREGHRVILLSASPDVYVPNIARQLGITEVVCTQVASDGVSWGGAIIGPNCKGAAKLTRLQEHLGYERWEAESFAYGDQPQDLAVLQWARTGYMVTRRAGLVQV